MLSKKFTILSSLPVDFSDPFSWILICSTNHSNHIALSLPHHLKFLLKSHVTKLPVAETMTTKLQQWKTIKWKNQLGVLEMATMATAKKCQGMATFWDDARPYWQQQTVVETKTPSSKQQHSHTGLMATSLWCPKHCCCWILNFLCKAAVSH